MTQHKVDVVIELLELLDKRFVVDDPAPIRRRVFDELLADDLVSASHPRPCRHIGARPSPRVTHRRHPQHRYDKE